MSSDKYYSHPYVTPSGIICYKYYNYPCPESKTIQVLGEALEMNIPKLYNKINEDTNSSDELKKKAQDLYDRCRIVNSLRSHNLHVNKPEHSGMDEDNKKLAKIVMEKAGKKELKKE